MLVDTREVESMPEIIVTIGDPIGVGYGAINAEGMDVDAAAQELVTEVEDYLREVAEDAPSSCIDGRKCVACMDGSCSEPRPGVAGGGLISAYAAAELVGWFADDATDSSERLRLVYDFLASQGVAIGAHCDQGAIEAEFKGKTGCGANDNLPKILHMLHENKAVVDQFTRVVLEKDYATENTIYVPQDVLDERHKGWKPETMIDEVGTKAGEHSIEILESDHTPTHGHHELAVVFNNVENTTVDRDALYDATGKQVFDVDVWYLRKLAKAMATGPDAENQEKQLLHGMVAYQVATYLTLCNGSQRPIFVKEKYALAA